MCLLIAAKKGVSKSDDFLMESIKKASITNTDGIGFAFKRHKSNKIYICKGFHDVDDFVDLLLKKNLKIEDELIVHLRIGNKGAKTTAMNHPFVLSDDDETILTNGKYVDLPVMAHNGTFYDYAEYTRPESDTYCFARDFMSVSEIQDLLKRDQQLFSRTFKHTLKSNKLAFIFPDNTPLITVGEFKEDQGYMFSNDSYIRKVYNVGGVTHAYTCCCPQCTAGKMTSRWGEYDEIEDTKPVINSKYNNYGHNSFAISSVRETEAEIEMKKILSQAKGTKVGERKRDSGGLLTFDPKFDISPANTSGTSPFTSIFNLPNTMTLYPVAGHFLYTPVRYLHTQFESTIFTPKLFNYKHFTYFNPLGNPDRNISPREVYKIDEFNSDVSSLASKFEVHFVVPVDYDPSTLKKVTDTVWFTTNDIIRYFRPIIATELRPAYLTLYRLLQKYTVPSKNLCAQSQKAINGALKKEESKHNNITFKQTNGCTLLGLKLFYNYQVSVMYDSYTAKKMYYKVQEEDKNNYVSFQEAIDGVNAMKN